MVVNPGTYRKKLKWDVFSKKFNLVSLEPISIAQQIYVIPPTQSVLSTAPFG